MLKLCRLKHVRLWRLYAPRRFPLRLPRKLQLFINVSDRAFDPVALQFTPQPDRLVSVQLHDTVNPPIAKSAIERIVAQLASQLRASQFEVQAVVVVVVEVLQVGNPLARRSNPAFGSGK